MITDAVITARDLSRYPGYVRPQLIEFLCALGVPDPGRSWRAEWLVIDVPLIRVSHYAQDADGQLVVDPESRDLLSTTRDYLADRPLPEWWRPCV